MNNIAIIRQGTGRYLFSVPENVTLREGDRVKCDTKRGITDGIAFADSAWVDENVSQLIGKLTGAKFPLKPVVGKLEYLPFEKPEDKPAEDKPIKLCCVKDYCSGSTLTGGKTYDFVDGRIKYDSGENSSWHANAKELCEAINENTETDLIFPLVKRPAKVGESFLIVAKNGLHIPPVEIGNIFVAAKKGAHFGGKYVDTANGNRFYDQHLEYLVLDGYQPEPEPEAESEPEYYNGKVVCVSSGDECFTVGKMYEFVNGKIKDDEGDERPVCYDQQFKSVEEWNSEYGMPIARFIEFKGEVE